MGWHPQGTDISILMWNSHKLYRLVRLVLVHAKRIDFLASLGKCCGDEFSVSMTPFFIFWCYFGGGKRRNTGWDEIVFVCHDCTWFPKVVTKYWGSPTEQCSVLHELVLSHSLKWSHFFPISSKALLSLSSRVSRKDGWDRVPWVNVSLWLWVTLYIWLALNNPLLSKMLIWRRL